MITNYIGADVDCKMTELAGHRKFFQVDRQLDMCYYDKIESWVS